MKNKLFMALFIIVITFIIALVFPMIESVRLLVIIMDIFSMVVILILYKTIYKNNL